MANYILDLPSGIYRITDTGEVYSQSKIKIPLVGKGMKFTGKFKTILKPERALKQTINNRGYYSVKFANKTYMVHRLVAKGFCSNLQNKPFVNHIDGNKLNNCATNLEWCTTAENNHHARVTGLHKQAKGHKIKYKSAYTKAKSLANIQRPHLLTDDEVRWVRQVHKPRHPEFSTTALAQKFGISVAGMSAIIRRKNYSHIK